MAKLTTRRRKSLKSSVFGLPKERKYPMPDRSHAANAKARAAQQVKKGNLNEAEKRRIDAKADRILYGRNEDMKGQGRKDKEDERRGMRKEARRKRRDRRDEREGMERKGRRRDRRSDNIDRYMNSL